MDNRTTYDLWVEAVHTGATKLGFGAWTNYINEYDNTEIFNDRTEEYSDEEAIAWGNSSEQAVYLFTKEELATVLAALRYYQNDGQGEPAMRLPDIHEIATNCGTLISLDETGIEELCQRLNQ